MNKTIKIYIVFLVLLLVGIIFIDANRPKPVDWTPTYGINDKIPFGMYIFKQEAESVFKNQKVNSIFTTPYEYFEPLYDYDSLVNTYTKKGNVLSISESYLIDEESTQEILYFVQHGNKAFISSKNFPQKLMDSLKFTFSSKLLLGKKVETWMANPKLGSQKYDISMGAANTYFDKIDTLTTTVLGYQGDKEKLVNFIKVPYGEGEIYLHSQPAAFTNYHLLKDNHSDYAAKVLSYVGEGEIYWFLKNQSGIVVSNSPLRYILSQPALKWAMYISLIGMLIFIIFTAKRKQRIISIIKPLPNTTVDFTKTIGNLYFQEGNHDNIIEKKIIYFLEKIRNEYLLDTTILDDAFIKKLHYKTGQKLEDIERVVYLINNHRKNYHRAIEGDLIALNTAIEKVTTEIKVEKNT